MPVIKYSRQRESIKQFLMGRKDHPTADVVYRNVRREFPHISLGTVYRNLSLLSELGEISKISTDGPDRFDANQDPHYHFICRQCHVVLDLPLPHMEQMEIQASQAFGGLIEGHTACFYGLCPACAQNAEQAEKKIDKQENL